MKYKLINESHVFIMYMRRVMFSYVTYCHISGSIPWYTLHIRVYNAMRCK